MSVPTDKVVLNYLNKKGYRHAEEFLQEKTGQSGSLENVAFDIHNEQDMGNNSTFSGFLDPIYLDQINSRYSHGVQFTKFRKWIHNSLDVYKTELSCLLYPIFIHLFLDMIVQGMASEAKTFVETYRHEFEEEHQGDIEKISLVSDVVHIKENHLATLFRTNKYNIKISLYSFELLIIFLYENKFSQLRKIVNQYLNIIVFEGSSTDIDSLSEGQTPFGHIDPVDAHLNLPRVYWGSVPQNSRIDDEVWHQFKNELAETMGHDQIQSIVSQIKKLEPEVGKNSPPKGKVPLPDVDIELEVKRLKELSKRINVDSKNPISACCYTVHNTFDTLNSLTFSNDFDMMAGGFSNSQINIWSLKNEMLRGMKKSTDLALFDYEGSLKIEDIKEEVGSSMKKLVGHSGPVYGCSFGDDLRILISSSQDSTLRLWSLDTFSNIVCYRGHEGPVWDVSMGPKGYYFASASSDRTARLWTTDNVQQVRYFIGHIADVETVRFHRNSNYIATGSADKTVRMWDIQQGKSVRLFMGHKSPVSSVAFSGNGRLIASGDVTGKIILWDIASGRQLTSFNGHHRSVSSLVYSINDNILVSGGLDGTIHSWDVKHDFGENTDNPYLSKFYTKQTPVYSVHFTLRNLLLASGPFLPGSSLS